MTASMFDLPVPEDAKPSALAHFEKLAEAYGEQNKRGKYWYELFHAEVEKMHPQAKERLLSIILDSTDDTAKEVSAMLVKWHKSNYNDKDDFRRACGK